MFSNLDLVFFDTTSIYFEGEGGNNLGEKGFSKDHRPDLNQMVVGAIIDDKGMPICCEMWPGNTADVTTLIPVIDRLKKRFHISNVVIVADRGMISGKTLEILEDKKHPIPYLRLIFVKTQNRANVGIARHSTIWQKQSCDYKIGVFSGGVLQVDNAFRWIYT